MGIWNIYMSQNNVIITPSAKLRKKKNSFNIRLIVQIFFFVLLGLIAVNRFLVEQGNSIAWISTASAHALCPFGGVVSIYSVIVTGTLVHKVHQSAMVLMYIGFGLALVAGPAFCGWACPLGSFQEWLGKIGKLIFKRKYNQWLPSKIDNYLRYLRYAVLIWVIYVTATSATLVFADYDPYFALFNFWTGEVALSAFIILGLVIILTLAVERPFCKYACPYGAVLGIFNLFRVFRIERNTASCIDCKRCDRMCPMNIKVSQSGVVRNHQCISCLDCTSEHNCPVAATVELKSFPVKGGKMQVSQNEN
jgi:polyferredoxin